MRGSDIRREGDISASPAGGEGRTGTADHAGRARTAPARSGGGPPQRPSRRRPKPPRRRWVRALRWTAAGLAVAVLGAGVAGYLYVRHLNSNLTKEERHLGDSTVPKPAPNSAGQTPLNILLLGSDSRNSEENLELGGSRSDVGRKELADTQILLHVSADRSHLTALSVPRDTRVTIPECTDPEDGTVYPETDRLTINRSLQHGGPGCTVAAWEQFTGLYIDHFMKVDFAGVVSMADAVGGVPVCVRENIDDPKSGLRLPKGENIVRGEEALQWLRTRHAFEDGSDIGRTKAQQMYLTSMARELQEGTQLTDPARLMNLAEAATRALTVDDGLGTVNRLYDLGRDLRQVPSSEITMVTLPWLPDPLAPSSHVIPDEEEAEAIFTALRNDVALDDEEGQREAAAEEQAEAEREAEAADHAGGIPVAVLNGTGFGGEVPVDGRAGTVTAALQQQGFTMALADATPVSQAETTLRYPGEEQRANALAVAVALGLPREALQENSEAAQLVLVIGADWRDGTVHPAAHGQPREDGEPPEDTGGGSGSGEAGTGSGEESILDTTEAVTGGDEDACMEVNPFYTW